MSDGSADRAGSDLPPRHALVWPNEAGRARFGAEAPAPLRGWIAAGRPLVRRRTLPTDAAGDCPVAATLPAGPAGPARGRFAAVLRPGEIARWTSPPTLAELHSADTLPAAWCELVDALLRLGQATAVLPRVFGSAMWQHLSGDPFLHPDSDLDLLWPVTVDTALPALLAELHRLGDGPPRLDGEILFGNAGVQWREWRDAAPDGEVLVKDATGIRIRSACSLWPEDTK